MPVFVPAAAAVFTFLQSEMPDRGHQFIHSWCRICVLASSRLMRCCCLKYMHTLMQQSSEEEEKNASLKLGCQGLSGLMSNATWLIVLVLHRLRACISTSARRGSAWTRLARPTLPLRCQSSTTLPLTNKKFDAFSILTLAFQYQKYIKDRSSLRSQLFLCAKKKRSQLF